MRQVKTVVGLVLLLPLGLALALGLTSALIPDEALNPQVEALLQTSEITEDDRTNGFYLLAGFVADEQSNPELESKRWLAETNKTLASPDYHLSDCESAFEPAEHTLQASDAVAELCDATEQACLNQYGEQTAELSQLMQEHRVLLARYEQLMSYSHISNRMPTDYCVPLLDTYAQLVSMNRLRGAWLVSQANAQALEQLLLDLIWARAWAAQANTLIDKMIALKLVENDLHLLLELKGNAEIQGLDMEPVPRMTSAELSFQKVMRTEFQYAASLLARVKTDAASSADFWERWGIALFYKTNRTINGSYAQFIRQWQAQETQQAVPEETYAWWNYLKNPIGTVFLEYGPPSINQYVETAHEMDGLIEQLNQ